MTEKEESEKEETATDKTATEIKTAVIRPTVINPAVFAYTLWVKFANWRNCLPLIMLMILPSFGLGVALLFSGPEPVHAEAQTFISKIVVGYSANTLVCILAVYFFISDALASQKVVSESDSLSLLFTRPITRFSYVMSKFCAAVVGATTVLSLSVALAFVTTACFGIHLTDINYLTYLSVLCNVASWAAVVVFLHSAHPLVSIITYICLTGTAGLGAMFASTSPTSNTYLEIYKSICLFLYEWLGDLMPAPIDLNALCSAIAFDTYEFGIFISNIAFFLLLASFTLSRRSFSYGSD